MQRIREFSHKLKLNVRLAYYPPDSSKYNPVEQTWGILENPWDGSILDEIETVLKFDSTMNRKGKRAVVKLITDTYETGIKLTSKAMAIVETAIQGLTNSSQAEFPDLGRWFVHINWGFIV